MLKFLYDDVEALAQLSITNGSHSKQRKTKERPRSGQGMTKQVLHMAGHPDTTGHHAICPNICAQSGSGPCRHNPSIAGTPPCAHKLKLCNPHANQIPTNTAVAAAAGAPQPKNQPTLLVPRRLPLLPRLLLLQPPLS
jgi:hypothetical protein